MKSKIYYCAILCFILFVFSVFGTMASSTEDNEKRDISTKHVLYISSYSPSFPTFNLQLEGLKTVIGDNVDIKIEYMDSKVFYKEKNMQIFYDKISYKLKESEPFDVIVVADDNALQFAMDFQDEIFKNIPIVFLGVNDVERAKTAGDNPYISGVVEQVSLEETIEIAVKLNEEATDIIVLVDDTETGRAELEIVNQEKNKFALPVKVLNLGEYTFEEMSKVLNNISSDSIVLLLSFYRDRTGKTITYNQLYEYIRDNCDYPIYRLYSEGLGEGFLGGKLVSHIEQGKQAGIIVKRVFNGTDIKNIPIISDSPNVYLFDYNIIQKYNINEKLLPKVTEFINKEPNFYDKYTLLFWTSIIVFSCLFVLIIIMIFNIMKRKKTEKELVKSHRQLAVLNKELEESEDELRNQIKIIQENKKEILKSKELYKYVFLATSEGLWDMHVKDNKLILSSDWYRAFFGKEYNLENGKFEDWYKIIYPDDLSIFEDAIKEINTSHKKKITCEYRVIDNNNNIVWLQQTSISFYDKDGNLTRVIGSHNDITTRKLQENKIRKLAYSDQLTGLPNRIALQEKLSYILEGEDGICNQGAIMFLDIDNFKYINDTYGHIIGDRILKEVGYRLNLLESENTFVFRFGGDEFVVIVNSKKDIYSSIAEHIIELLEKKYYIDEKEFFVSTSIGIVNYPDNGVKAFELLKNADMAMYKAKEKGKSRYQYFNKEMNKEVYDKMIIHNNLRNAANNEEFKLYYQPQIDAKTQKIVGFEALIRWDSKELGDIPPLRFIKIAEESDLIIKIGNWVLREACIFSKEINKDREIPYIVSVNVSPIQLRQDNFLHNVKSIMGKVGVDPHYMGIEITETALMKTFEINANKIRRLGAIGIKIGLDDFGTGYSSLNYLRRLPIHILKIDKTFIDDLLVDEDIYNLTEDIIKMSKRLGLKVVAEGVETKEQYDILCKYGCEIIQGYLISKPIPEEDVINLLNKPNN